MKKKIVFFGILLITILTILLFLILFNFKVNNFKTDYENLDLSNIDKLMIVAHPDDDILWGSTKLVQGNFLVVCVTCGKSNPSRVKEFQNVMNKTNDEYVLLNYPDKTRGKRDNWKTVKKSIINDLEKIYQLKKWTEVVTHNPDGEYGHIHHKMTSEYVTNIVDKESLVYFGRYYSKKKLEEDHIVLPKMGKKQLDFKNELLSLYESQAKTIDSFSHMIPTEEFVPYKEWMEKYK